MIRPENEPSLQNKTEPIPARRQKGKFGRGFVITLASFAALMASIWILIAIYGLTVGT
ncbi:hypothetical protein [Agrobacterium tumefaciens]|uniref:hypothetical protein n=1 Tax=Agrobacterium tumefaciens TaxID=358 RepID=UPI0016470337|nr:hypothetical protein [Agrobacterium tumefaciens]